MRLWPEILQVEHTLFRKIFNHYRPELHYMRGPGPKWLEKHSAVAECAMPQVSGSGGSSLPPECPLLTQSGHPSAERLVVTLPCHAS